MLCQSYNNSQTHPQTESNKDTVNLSLSYWDSRSDSKVYSTNEEVIRELYDLVKNRLEMCSPDLLEISTKVRRGIQVGGLIPVEFRNDIWTFSFVKCYNACARIFFSTIKIELQSNGWEMLPTPNSLEEVTNNRGTEGYTFLK